jgi:hypothetical protein
MPTRFANSANSVKIKAMNSHKSAPLKNSESRTLFEDPIVKEVRDARHKLASQLGNDLQQIAHDLMLRQKQLGDRLRAS